MAGDYPAGCASRADAPVPAPTAEDGGPYTRDLRTLVAKDVAENANPNRPSNLNSPLQIVIATTASDHSSSHTWDHTRPSF